MGTRLKNYKASLPSKLNQVCIDGEPYNSSGPSFTPGVVNGHDEFTKRQVSLPAIGFHGLKCNRASSRAIWGVYPICVFLDSTPAHVSGLEEHQLDAKPGSKLITAANHRLMTGFDSLAAAR